MGKVESKVKNAARNKESVNLYHQGFNELSNGKPAIDRSAFFKSTQSTMSPLLQSFIFESLSKPGNAISEQRFVQFAKMMLGDYDQQAEALLQLQQPLKQVLEALVSTFLKCEGLNTSSATLLVDFLMDDVPKQLDTYSLSSFIQRKMILLIMIQRISELLLPVERRRRSALLPEAPCKQSLLTPAALCLLYANLPEESRSQWKLLFSSEKDGESFTKLLKSVDDAGASLVVIETTAGRVFGAFANEGFRSGPTHIGDNRCFLFEDRQRLRIYNATGYNSNFAYLNSHQTTLPNGIGMGGNGENWSLFVHEDFGSGTSTSGISTFEKCWLAGENTFKPKNVEIWQIGEKRKEVKEGEEEDDVLQGDIAQQRAVTNKRETRAILEISGKEFRGDVFREQKNT